MVLRLTTRDGVLWSDGAPFSARDVAFTFNLLDAVPGARSARRLGLSRERRRAGRPHGRVPLPAGLHPGLRGGRGAADRARAHLARGGRIRSPSPTRTRSRPVPSPRCALFRNQVFELGRNPHYWQPGRPRIEALRFPAYPANDRANLALVFVEVDWAGNFVPAIDRVFVRARPRSTTATGSRSPAAPSSSTPTPRARRSTTCACARRSAWPSTATCWSISRSYRYSRPADATALSDAYAAWRNPEIAASGDWVRHDLARASALLDEAGYRRGADGVRLLPDGSPWRYEILTVAGWSDWVRASQVIARGLRPSASRSPCAPTISAPGSSACQEGDFDLSLGWSFEGPTPYSFYRWLMASATVKPVGESAMGNWHRYASPAADSALAAFEQESALANQRRIADELQRIFVAEAPGDPALPEPVLGRVQHEPLRRVPIARATLRGPVAEQVRPRRVSARADVGQPTLGGECALLAQRLGFYLLAAWVALTLNFFLPRLMPGDPATALFARFRGRLSPEAMRGPPRDLRPDRRTAPRPVLDLPAARRAR